MHPYSRLAMHLRVNAVIGVQFYQVQFNETRQKCSKRFIIRVPNEEVIAMLVIIRQAWRWKA